MMEVGCRDAVRQFRCKPEAAERVNIRTFRFVDQRGSNLNHRFVNNFRRRPMIINRRKPRHRFAALAMAACCSLPGGVAHGVQTDDPAAKADIETPDTVATGLTTLLNQAREQQQAGQFAAAADTWRKILDDHPDSADATTARFNLGFCLNKTERYAEAIDELKTVLPALRQSQSPQVPDALLYLGFAQLQRGKQLAAANIDAASLGEETSIELTTATQSFEQLLSGFPDYAHADQAALMQGESFELLSRMGDAEAAYRRALSSDREPMKMAALYALGGALEREGKNSEALDSYRALVELADTTDGPALPLLADARFAYAETLIREGLAARQRGQTKEATDSFKAADGQFDLLNGNPDSPLIDRTLFQQAYVAHQLNDYSRSAELYARVSKIPESTLASQATLLAGREYQTAGDDDKAIGFFRSAIEASGENSIEAVHQLASLFVKDDRGRDAFELTEQWIPAAREQQHPMLADLEMDRADAAWAVPALRDRSVALYREVADTFPEHRLAPRALYNAAFAQLDTGDTAGATVTAGELLQRYPDSDFQADAGEVVADGLLLEKQYADAEAKFRRLVLDHPNHEKASVWIVRAGLASHLQGNDDATIEWLSPQIDSLATATLQSEALHWIGASHVRLEQYPQAIDALVQSLSLDADHAHRAGTLESLLKSYAASGDMDRAEQTLVTLSENFPESPRIAESLFELGDAASRLQRHDVAIEFFRQLTNQYPDNDLVPFAVSGIAWSELKRERFDDAADQFTLLIEKWPSHELVANATLGRGIALRNTGDSEQSIVDLKTPDPEIGGDDRAAQRYELALAYIDDDKQDLAAETLTELLTESPPAEIAEKATYKLAWVLDALGRQESSLQQFATLADGYAAGPFAAEANFMVGIDAYDRGDYQTAIDRLSLADTETAADDLREKAIYRMGWAFYRQGKYDQALDQFQRQVDLFQDGEFFADSLFMVGQSHFALKNYQDALKAYVVAKPVVETAGREQMQQEMLLHAARSGNRTGEYRQALDMAALLIESSGTGLDDPVAVDAWLETGLALKGLGKSDQAIAALDRIVTAGGVTGIRARCMKGDVYFQEGLAALETGDDETANTNLKRAVDTFMQACYGHGGLQAIESVRPWQAYAAYEAARANIAMINDTAGERRDELVDAAVRNFDYLVKHYSGDRLANQARLQLEKLRAAR